jgi:hypothetical protein
MLLVKISMKQAGKDQNRRISRCRLVSRSVKRWSFRDSRGELAGSVLSGGTHEGHGSVFADSRPDRAMVC